MTQADQYEIYMLGLINAERARVGADPLALELNLNVASELHSQWMLQENIFSHTGVGGSSANQRMRDAGFDFSGAWQSAENLAVQSERGAAGIMDDVQDLHVSLMDSPGHRANILDPALDYVGIGVERGNFSFSSGTYQSVIVTQTFAATGGTVDLDTGAADDDGPVMDSDDEVVTGTGADDNLEGGGGNDTLSGNAGNDLLRGGADDDLLNGGFGFDVMHGDAGHDTLIGLQGFDTLHGSAGNDLLRGNAGNDLLYGGDDADRLEGGIGFDTIHGDAGDDILTGLEGFDALNGGAGADTLLGNAGNDVLYGGGDADRLEGGIGFDTLNGDAGNDVIFAGNGFDLLFGGAGVDRLEGNAGNDTLDGGAGADVLKGGIGVDTFVFMAGSGADRVADFQNAIDAIEIDAALMGGGTPVAADLIAFAGRDADGFLILDFGNGDTLTFTGVTNTGAILDEVTFI